MLWSWVARSSRPLWLASRRPVFVEIGLAYCVSGLQEFSARRRKRRPGRSRYLEATAKSFGANLFGVEDFGEIANDLTCRYRILIHPALIARLRPPVLAKRGESASNAGSRCRRMPQKGFAPRVWPRSHWIQHRRPQAPRWTLILSPAKPPRRSAFRHSANGVTSATMNCWMKSRAAAWESSIKHGR